MLQLVHLASTPRRLLPFRAALILQKDSSEILLHIHTRAAHSYCRFVGCKGLTKVLYPIVIW